MVPEKLTAPMPSTMRVLTIVRLACWICRHHPPNSPRLRAAQPPWSTNTLALAALVAAAKHPDGFAKAAARAREERQTSSVDWRTWPESVSGREAPTSV